MLVGPYPGTEDLHFLRGVGMEIMLAHQNAKQSTSLQAKTIGGTA